LSQFDVVIIGAGIVGLATARALAESTSAKIAVIEKENRLAAHQTGNNSGVIHSGLYYKPGSLKAQNCVAGREQMYEFCQRHEIPHDRCGKLVVATDAAELPRLDNLQQRGEANGLPGLKRLRAEELKGYEAHVSGIAGLFVPETGIVNYNVVCEVFARLLQT